MATVSTKTAAALADLQRSGLSKRDFKTMGIYIPSKKEMVDTFGSDFPCYALPYFDINGTKTGFVRYKILQELRTGFLKNAETKTKYLQPPNTVPEIYFIPGAEYNNEAPWIVVEGEKKAYTGAIKLGLPNVIGVGGVASFQSKKKNVYLLPSLKILAEDGVNFEICYDSDLNYKPQVTEQMIELGNRLTENGAAAIDIRLLPDIDDRKCGLDDYFIAGFTIDDYYAEALVPFEEFSPVAQLNSEVVYIKNLAGIYQKDVDIVISEQKFLGLTHANRKFKKLVVATDSKGSIKKDEDGKTMYTEKVVSAAKEWLTDPHRPEYKKLDYKPGQPEVIINKDGTRNYNKYRAPDITIKKGSIKPFIKLVDFVFSDDLKMRDYFWQWLAYQVQHPGIKLYSSFLIIGGQGTGKTLLGICLKKLFGEQNFALVEGRHVFDTFNSAFACKQFIVIDEMSQVTEDRKETAERLKSLVTQETRYINEKYQRQYELDAVDNIYMTTNHMDTMFVENDDRRFAIHRILKEKPERPFYKEVDAWKDTDEGAGALLYYLLNEVDTSKFDAKGPAPDSETKQDVIDLSRTDLEKFAHALKLDPDGTLTLPKDRRNPNSDHTPLSGDLFTAGQLWSVYDPVGKKPEYLSALGKALSKEGFMQTKPMKVKGVSARLWVMRNTSKWLKNGIDNIDTDAVREHVEKTAQNLSYARKNGRTKSTAGNKAKAGKITGNPRKKPPVKPVPSAKLYTFQRKKPEDDK